MKKLSTLLSALIMAHVALAQQNNLVVFSEDGHPFHLIVNGVAQNSKPETSVRVDGLTVQSNRLKFIFDDDVFGTADKTIFMSEFGREYTYKVKHSEATGDLVIKLEGSKPVPGLMPQPVAQPAYNTSTQTNVGVSAGGGSTSVNTTTNGTSVAASSSGTNSSYSMSVSVSGIGVNPNLPGGHTMQEVQMVEQTIQATRPTHYVMAGYTGPIGCPWPIEQGQFGAMKQSIASKTWDETKLSQAKTMISSNCLTASQVRDLIKLMGWEQTRLDLAKFAYGYTYDIGNYWMVNDAFEWEQSITELNAYIAAGR